MVQGTGQVEFEDQLSGLVEGVVGIFDFALFDELAVEVTALVANTAWDVHGKDTPLDGNNALKIDESMFVHTIDNSLSFLTHSPLFLT